MYDAVVVGAGPGGLASVSALLDGGLSKILWIDRDFNGGRLNTLYREISSNTKVGIYLDAITSSPACRRIIEAEPKPNAVTRLEAFDRDETCQLSVAGDMLMMLLRRLFALAEVETHQGEVNEATLLEDGTWEAIVSNDSNSSAGTSASSIRTRRVILCTGSHPTPASFHREFNEGLEILDLDRCMVKSTLPNSLPQDRRSTVAVIGNSHSGVLVCRNLYEISNQSSPSTPSPSPSSSSSSASHSRDVRIVNFQRSPIRYAEYRDDGIVYDNTGLKGSTADWAKQVMETDEGSGNNMQEDKSKGIIAQVKLGDTEDDHRKAYEEWLPTCTHLVYAIGYTPSPIPRLYRVMPGGRTCGNSGERRVDGGGRKRIDEDIEFDMHSSGFRIRGRSGRSKTANAPGVSDKSDDASNGNGNEDGEEDVKEEHEHIPGLFGCGIAFPEEVADPEGHVEAAVGLAKFFKLTERVKEQWATGSVDK